MQTKNEKPNWNDPIASPRRRELFLRVVNGVIEHQLTYRLSFLNEHFPTEKLDAALEWLIANGHVGRGFVQWFKVECKASDLEMLRLLTSVVDNAKLGAVIAGKEFRV